MKKKNGKERKALSWCLSLHLTAKLYSCSYERYQNGLLEGATVVDSLFPEATCDTGFGKLAACRVQGPGALIMAGLMTPQEAAILRTSSSQQEMG